VPTETGHPTGSLAPEGALHTIGSSSAQGPPPDADEESEPLTPELVEEEAIRGDFVLRWGVVLLAFLMASTRIGDTSVLVHVRTGQYLAAHGILPPALDVFSYTAEDRPWTNLTWGFDLLAAGIHAIGSFAGLSVVKAVAVGVAFWLIGRVSRPGIPTWWGSICGVIAILGCHLRFSADPDLVTIPGMALAITILHGWRESQSSKRLWLYVPLMIVWCNFDGRAWLGLALLVLYAAGDSLGALLKSPNALSAAARSNLWKVAGVSVAATLVHPFGWKSLAAPWWTYTVEYPAFRNYIAETYLGSNLPPAGMAMKFFPMTIAAFWTHLDLASCASLCIFVATGATLIMNRLRIDWGHVAIFLGFVLLAIASLHELPIATFVCCPLATLNGQSWYVTACRQTYSIDRREVLLSQGGRALTVLVVAGIAFFGGTGRLRDSASTAQQTGYGLERDLEMRLTDLQQQLAGDASFDHHPFHTLLSQGDELIWAGEKVFADSRVGVYFANNDEDNLLARQLLTRDALCSTRERAADSRRSVWHKTFNKYHLTHVVLRLVSRRDYENFGALLRDSANWEWTSLGAAATVFYRIDDDPALGDYIKSHAVDFQKRAYSNRPAGKEVELVGRDRGIRPPSFYQRYFWTHRRQSTAEIHEAMHLASLATLPLPRRLESSRPAMVILAIRLAQAGLARDPDDVNGYLVLGSAYDFLAQVEAAAVMNGSRPARTGVRYLQTVCAYNQALVGSPDNMAANAALMRIYSEAGKIDLALRHSEACDEALSADPVENSDALAKLGSQIGQLRKARESVEDQMAELAAKENDPIRLAQAYVQRGCILAALREIDRGGAQLLRNLGAERFRIMLLLEAGRIDEAHEAAGPFAAAAEQAGFRDGTDVVAVASLALGEYRGAAEQWVNAADSLEKQAFNGVLLSLAPHAPWPLAATGTALDFLYQRPEALAAPRVSAALAYLEWGQIEKALRLFHEVLTSNPDTASRPLVAFYLRELTHGKEEIDPEYPSNRIIESFAPEPGEDEATEEAATEEEAKPAE
jgi:tetratricopeptide (TPR) repeat protein